MSHSSGFLSSGYCLWNFACASHFAWDFYFLFFNIFRLSDSLPPLQTMPVHGFTTFLPVGVNEGVTVCEIPM